MKEFTELRQELNEGAVEEHVNVHHASMPPNILILRRQTVRQFPNHTMVALYYNDKLDQYFSIPYGGPTADDSAVVTPVALKEDEAKEDLYEGVMSHLERVKSFQTDKPLYHHDGSQTKIDPQTANALLTVHKALHPDNQKKMADAMEHSKGKFHKIVDFAWKQVK
jgi:hypothetical protein